MAKPVKHVALIKKEDFPWSQKMTKKDRAAFSAFFDKICKELDAKTDSILDLGEQLEKNKKKYIERFSEMESRIEEKNTKLLKLSKTNDVLVKALSKLKKETIILGCLTIIIIVLYAFRVFM